MDIDGIFKLPTVPASKLNKRKLPPSHDESYLKRLKTDDNDEDDFRTGWGPGKVDSKAPEPVVETDQDPAEDEGRFYGDGLTAEQQEIWDIVDVGEEAPETIDLPTLKKMILKFEKVINKNQDLRVRFADDPIKFIESEADLDEEIKNMHAASVAPELYGTLVSLGTHVTMLGLLSHENTDISIAAVELINELTDDDLVAEAEEEAEEGMRVLVKAFIENDALSLLVQNLNRLNEAQTEDRQGVFNTLSVVENFISIDPDISEQVVANTTLLTYLLQRIRAKMFDSNRQYASELLAVLMQKSRPNRLKLGELGGIDTLLRVLSGYKRRDPKDPDEIEMMENLFDVLCAVLAEPEIKALFLEGEGIELMLLMIKEKKLSRMRAFKVLSHAILGVAGAPSCAHFVEIFGLKTLFPAFMRKGLKSYKKEYKSFSESEENEYIVSTLASLFKSLTSLEARERLMLKFLEGDHEKVDRLLQIHEQYFARVKAADATIAKRKAAREEEDLDDDEKEAADEDDFLDRLNAGVFTLQLVDFVIAFACYEDSEGKIKQRVRTQLTEMGQSLDTIKTVLKGMHIHPFAQNALRLKPINGFSPVEYAQSVGESNHPPADGAAPTEDADDYTQRERAMIIGVSEAL
ncbi:hypothetical protein HKX48_003657 [Thoreauomyces humboldtii]|nr:hypothetical protein HKX48_003657 [Thoreauomyces humboldtii]